MRYELDFLSPDGSSFLFEINISQGNKDRNKDENIKRVIQPILYRNYLQLLLENFTYNELYKLYSNKKVVPVKELEKLVWKKDMPIYKCLAINKIIECIGCRDGILNQMGHMEEGGCLYPD